MFFSLLLLLFLNLPRVVMFFVSVYIFSYFKCQETYHHHGMVQKLSRIFTQQGCFAKLKFVLIILTLIGDVFFVSISTSLNFDTTAGQPSDHLKAVLKVKHSSISMYIYRCSPHFTVKIFPGVNQTVRCKRFTPFQMQMSHLFFKEKNSSSAKMNSFFRLSLSLNSATCLIFCPFKKCSLKFLVQTQLWQVDV